MNKKYTLVEPEDELLKLKGFKRLKALRDFADVKAGDLGGYIMKERNLDHKGDCWVYDDAKIYDDARIFGNARVINHALVYGNAMVHDEAVVGDSSEVFQHAEIGGYARVLGDSEIFEYANVSGVSTISGSSKVGGHAYIVDSMVSSHSIIRGSAFIGNYAHVHGYAILDSNSYVTASQDYIVIGPTWDGMKNGYITFAKRVDEGVIVNTRYKSLPLRNFFEYLRDENRDEDHHILNDRLIDFILTYFGVDMGQ